PKPANDTKQIPDSKPGVTENKAPVPESKNVEGQAPPTVKKDGEVKIPDSLTGEKEDAKAVSGNESKNVKTPLPPAEKRLDEKGEPETALKEKMIITGVPEQEKSSGQVVRGSIPSKKETVKQGTAPEKPEGQAPSTDKTMANDMAVKPEKIDTKKQETADIIRDETTPVKSNTGAVGQSPDVKGVEPLKTPDQSESQTINTQIDQAKGATLQVGAYKEEANAAILKKQLISLGRTAFYRYETAEGLGDLYRIYITGYKTLGEAVKDAKTLVESGVITGYARVHKKIPVTIMPPEKADAAENETGSSIYFIHTGSFKEEVNAQRVVASLKESGYKAFYVPEKEPSVTWFRVYIGDFRSEAQAREKGMELLEKGIITYFKPVAIMPQEKGN
ncbi:MAG: SPOR domain-containing protein, partial [Methanosarcina sp.]|nr:SPOR domain-containing protein [Methanosarcina sp.]